MAADERENIETTEVVQNQIVDPTHQSDLEDDGKKSTLARIADLLKGKKAAVEDEPEIEVASEPTADVEETPETEVDEGEASEEEIPDTDGYEEIDPRFVAAARSYGWSDDRIIEYSESHDDRDFVMLTGMMETSRIPETDETTPESEPDTSDKYQAALGQLEKDENVDDLTKQLLRSLVTDLKSARDEVKALSLGQVETAETKSQQEWVGRLQTADEQFDSVSKEFPELGTAKTLKRLPDGSLNPNDPCVQTREQLFKMATTLFASGSSWDRAVKDALRWYKGGREDLVEAKVLQKIKANSKRVSPKREQRFQTRQFKDEGEEKAAVVNAALRKHGIELPE
jgi:hypothetical protein